MNAILAGLLVLTALVLSQPGCDMSIIVFDTETTGMTEAAQVVEMGAVWEGGHSHFLIRPTVEVEPEARAAHHIPDKVLSTAALAEAWLPTVTELLGRGTPCFHNAEFDLRLIRQTWPSAPPVPRHICTYRCSLQVWPDAPSHANQVLRYWLGLDVRVVSNLHPHRALPDACVTWAILQELLKKHSEEELLAMSEGPVVLHRVRFGKHQGSLWKDVPRDYLEWVLSPRSGGDWDRDVLHTCRYYIERPIGTRLFTYQPGPMALTDGEAYAEHSGQPVSVLRSLPGAMYRIRAADGWEGNAHAPELSELPEQQPRRTLPGLPAVAVEVPGPGEVEAALARKAEVLL